MTIDYNIELVSAFKLPRYSREEYYELGYENSNISGIYFLFKKNRVIYIGKSNKLISRLFTHCKNVDIDFDEISYIKCNDKECNIGEVLYIDHYKPIENKEFITNKRAYKNIVIK